MRLQEEVEQRTVTLIVNTAKLTERELQKAISKLHTVDPGSYTIIVNVKKTTTGAIIISVK